MKPASEPHDPSTSGVPDPPHRPRRRLGCWLVAGGLLLLIVAAAVVLPMLVDVERHRGRIEAALRDATGWEPELGEMKLSLRRGLALTVSPVRLSAAQGSEVRIESLAVRAALRPLLNGRLEVQHIEVDRPEIHLVQADAETGWVLPIPTPDSSGTADAPADGGPPLEVSIRSVKINNGALKLEDRSVSPTSIVELRDLDLEIEPETMELRGAGRLAPGDATFEVRGKATETLIVELANLATEALAPFVGEDLLGPGGTLEGTVELRLPDRIDARLVGSQLRMASGVQPLDRAEVEFLAVADGAGWLLERLAIVSTGARVEGRGRISPDLDLEIEIPTAALAPAMQLARAVFDLPLELQSPGSARATVKLTAAAGEDPILRASGEIATAAFATADFLPAARDLKTSFELSPKGELRVSLLEGTVAGGPLRGTIVIDSVDSPGPVKFKGDLLDAPFGDLLAGFVDGASQRILGPAGFKADIALDLQRQPLDAGALRGTLGFSAREISMPGWDLEAAIRARAEEKLGKLAGIAAKLDSGIAEKLGLGAAEGATAPDGAAGKLREALRSLSADLDFNQIPWKLNRFSVESGGVRAEGGGSFDPATGEVSMQLSASLDEQQTADLLQRYPQVKILVGAQQRLVVPLSIDGSLLAPRIRPDLERAAANKLGTGKPEDAAKSALKDLLKKKLGR